MQPNGNMPGAGQPASPVRPVVPVGPTKPVNPAAPVKPAAPAGGPTFDNGPSVVDGKSSKKTGWILAVVLLLIVAIGGVGFGVWAMMDGNAQKDALNSQISTLKKQNDSLQEQLDEMAANNSVSDNINNNTDGEDYVYVGEADYLEIEDWGIKIKIPQDFTQLSYYLDSGKNESNDEYLYINGVLGVHENKLSFVGTPKSFSLGCLQRAIQGTETNAPWGRGDIIVSIDGYDYYYSSSQMLSSTNKVDEELEIETINAMTDVFTNAGNYSKI